VTLDSTPDLFLAKPFTRSELIDKIVTALRGHPEHDAKPSQSPHPSS
jgi:hypothetical protein